MKETLKYTLSIILDIMYNKGKLDFWYDRISKINYDNENSRYAILLFNKDKGEYKTIYLTANDISHYIIYDDE